jgi:adenosylcobinamide amidohydrolase
MRSPELALRNEDGQELAALVWRLPSPVLTASTAACGGGLGLRHWVVNVQVPGGYRRVDLDQHLAEIAWGTKLEQLGVGMFTAVDVRVHHAVDIDGARVVATVGVTHPAYAAAANAHTGAGQLPGTINVVAAMPQRMSEAALLNLIATVTEAKCQALADRGVPGTGTPSDAVTAFCPPDGEAASFGGPRSMWGTRVAQATHRAILSALDTGALR